MGTARDIKTLIVIDGHSLAFRSFYGTRLNSIIDGVHTNALYGFVNRFVSLLSSEDVSHFGVAFDVSRKSFRTEAYPEYKGTRKKIPEEFLPQVDLIKEFLNLLGVQHFATPNYEADDIIATLSKEAIGQGFTEVKILSGDRDLIQLVNKKVSLLFFSTKHRSGFAVYTPRSVKDRYGIAPHIYPDMAAMVGETSDNLPGITKVGEKTAATLLQKYGCLQKIIDSREEIPGAVGQNIRNEYHIALRNRQLNTLVDNLPLPCSVSSLVFPGNIDMGNLEKFMNKYRLGSITPRLFKVLQSFKHPKSDTENYANNNIVLSDSSIITSQYGGKSRRVEPQRGTSKKSTKKTPATKTYTATTRVTRKTAPKKDLRSKTQNAKSTHSKRTLGFAARKNTSTVQGTRFRPKKYFRRKSRASKTSIRLF